MTRALRMPLAQLLFSATFFGAALLAFAKICLGC
jgi:hypothetical protein